jgi:hypothetical protein
MSRQDKDRTKLPHDFEEYRERPDVQRHRTEAGELHRTASFDDRETRSDNAWKSDFQQKLARAKSYLPSTKPRTEEDREAVRDFIGHLSKMLSGRPAEPRRPWKKHIEQRGERVLIPEAVVIDAAVDAIAQLVREGQKVWRKENDAQRVPGWRTDELVNDFTKQIRRAWKIPETIEPRILRLVRNYRADKKK